MLLFSLCHFIRFITPCHASHHYWYWCFTIFTPLLIYFSFTMDAAITLRFLLRCYWRLFRRRFFMPPSLIYFTTVSTLRFCISSFSLSRSLIFHIRCFRTFLFIFIISHAHWCWLSPFRCRHYFLRCRFIDIFAAFVICWFISDWLYHFFTSLPVFSIIAFAICFRRIITLMLLHFDAILLFH